MYCSACERDHPPSQFSARQKRKPANVRKCRGSKCCADCVGGCKAVATIDFDVYLETTGTPEWAEISRDMLNMWNGLDTLDEKQRAIECRAKMKTYYISLRVQDRMYQ
jgi:hypothetical protein